jgi:oligoribonuclease
MGIPLVWIDLEMISLKIENVRVLEIACIITNGKLDIMVKEPELIINQHKECLKNMDQWCFRWSPQVAH